MIRLITTRRLARILGANQRHQTRDSNRVRDIDALRGQVDAGVQREGRLTAENAILRQQLAQQQPERIDRTTLLVRVRNAEDRARVLDERLLVLQAQNEQSYHLAYDAHLAATA